MKGKLKCVVALLLCMTMVFGTNLSTLADTNTAAPQTVQVQEAEQNVQEGEATQTAGEQQQTQETKETSSGETQTQQETQAEETQGGQTAQAEEKQNVQEEEKTEQETAQTPEGQGETATQTGEERSAVETGETSETQVTQERESNTEADINTLNAKEIYAYLAKLESDTSYFETWEMLNDQKKEEVNNYIDEITRGKIVTVNNDNGAVNFALVAPLVNDEEKKAAGLKLKSIMADTYNFTTENMEPLNGVEIKKNIKDYNPETGEGHLTLEAFVTGEKTTITKSKPIDVVLVLDQSGSMDEDFGSITEYQKQNWNNSTAFNRYQSHTEIYTPDENGEYCEVTISRNIAETKEQYEKKEDYRGRNPNYSSLLDQTYYYKDGDQYYALQVESQRKPWSFEYEYQISYQKNGQKIYLAGENGEFVDDQRTDFDVYRKIQEVTYGYTYTWTTSGGQTESITSEGARENPGIDLYIKTTRNASRLDALKDSVNKFVNSVEQDAEQNNVDHRIAIAGFSSSGYSNTEILTLSGNQSIRDNNGIAYNPNGTGYKQAAENALQSTLTQAGKTSIENAINALTADGGTETGDGVAMASDIFERQSQQYQEQYASGERKKVTIIFTDGNPTGDNTGYNPDEIPWDSGTVSESFSNVKTLKESNTTVYTVGIFTNANGAVNAVPDGDGENIPSPAASWNGTENANKFMHLLSSNYLDVNINNPMGTAKNKIRKDLEAVKDENGNILSYKSYYLSASDSEGLNNVFDQISDEIGGGATQKLDGGTVMFDELSDYFILPEDTNPSDIVVEVAKCTGITTGENGEKGYEFDNQPDKYDQAQVVINGKKVSITNFDYAQNWVGMNNGKVQGQKLIVTIPIKLDTNTTFGGNNLPTNKGTAGIYNQDGTECYGNFDKPVVNVPINYQTKVKDQVVYITNSADLTKLLEYADGYKPNGINNRFVDITYTLKQGEVVVGTYQIINGQTEGSWSWASDKTSNPVLKDCTDYTLECTVKASAPPTQNVWGTVAQDQTITGRQATVHVLTPEITVDDKCIFLGEKVDVNNMINSEKEVEWNDQKHEDTSKEDAFGTEPNITLDAVLVEGTEGNNLSQYQPEKDSNFNVQATIGGNGAIEKDKNYKIVNGKIIDCEDTHCYKPVENPENHDFTIHVVDGVIDITKILENSNDGNNTPEGDPIFTFKIEKLGTGDSVDKVWYRTIRFDEKSLGAADNLKNAELLNGLEKGKYRITELTTQKYNCSDVEGTIKEDSSSGIVSNRESITFEIGDPLGVSGTKFKRTIQATFRNTKTGPSTNTDTDVVVNRFVKDEQGNWTIKQIWNPGKDQALTEPTENNTNGNK